MSHSSRQIPRRRHHRRFSLGGIPLFHLLVLLAGLERQHALLPAAFAQGSGRPPSSNRCRVSARTNSVVYSPEGDRVAWAGAHGLVRIWDVPRRRLVAQLAGHHGEVHQVMFGKNSQTVYSAGEDGSILVWDVSEPRGP
jgi:WD40 repeat protein